jgi:hypothetical protein
MDAKQSALLADLHSKIVAGDFAETDVHALLMIAREDAPKNGALRELGDFIAHRRRDQGPVRRYMREVKAILDRLGTREEVLRIHVVFTEAEIGVALDAVFARQKLAPLVPNRMRQVQLAMLSMLQAVALIDDGRQFGVLALQITRDAFQLAGSVTMTKYAGVSADFPVLAVANDCYPMHAAHAHIKPDGLLRVSVRAGKTVLEGVKAYEVHIARKRERGRAAPPPIAWAEVDVALEGLPVSAVRAEAGEFDIHARPDHQVTFAFRQGRISFPGRPDYFAPESPVLQLAVVLKLRLGARVFDDTGSYLFETPETLQALEP